MDREAKAPPPRSRPLGITFSLKLSVLYALFFVVCSLGLFAAAYYLMGNYIEQGEREVIQARVQEYRAWYAEGGLAALKDRFQEQALDQPHDFFVRLVSPRGGVLFYSAPRGQALPDLDRLPGVGSLHQGVWMLLQDRRGEAAWTVACLPLGHDLVLQVGKSSTRSLRILARLRSLFLWFVVPTLLLGLLGGALLTYRALAPLRRIIETVRGILAFGELGRRVSLGPGGGELNELAQLFNRMLEKNQALIQGLHDSLDNVAHDLRTPMTRLRATAEDALEHRVDLQACREALADCLEESQRVLTMLDILMDVAEAETGAMPLHKEPVALGPLVDSVLDLYQVLAEEKGIRLQSRVPAELVVPADRARLGQVLANLVDNALKYSPGGTRVLLEARELPREVQISVSDQGQGIPPQDLERIWERLFRGDQSRGRRGLGLGLSLVRAVVQAHGGRARVQSRPGRGSVFTITLPRGGCPGPGQ